jgi:PAS domain S-box-containing protein
MASSKPGMKELNASKGYTANEIIGKPFSIFYRPDNRAKGIPEKRLATAKESGRFASEGWRIRKDGTRFWALVVIDAILVRLDNSSDSRK